MIKITIAGPQGCGKTLIAQAICAMLRVAGKKADVLEEGQKRVPYQIAPDVAIYTKQTAR
jgi:nucleoside-triphosphatase THEP1